MENDMSPTDVDVLASAEIDETARRRCCAGAAALNLFINNQLQPYLTGKKDPHTNIIDQCSKTTFNMPDQTLTELFDRLEVCRLEATTTHFSERQWTETQTHTGLMLDFDIFTPDRSIKLSDRNCYRLSHTLISLLTRELDFTQPGKKVPAIHIFFIVKPGAVETNRASTNASTNASTFKYGFHILVPSVQVSRGFKRWLVAEFAENPAVLATMEEMQSTDPKSCLDKGSASVPVLYFGSCKKGGTPYGLGSSFEAIIEAPIGGWAPPPSIRQLSAADLEPFNLVAELSLSIEAAYRDRRKPLVCKQKYLSAKDTELEEKKEADELAAEDQLLLDQDASISTLTLHDPDARHLHLLLDLLPPEYYTDRNMWRNVVFAIANTSERYKSLAVWFSRKSADKWADGGESALDALWADAVAKKGEGHPLTERSIMYWARSADVSRYKAAVDRSYFMALSNYTFDHGGRLEHFMVAKVLHMMLSQTFCVDIDSGSRGAQTYCWFEFVVPGQAMKPGEVWKWRKEVEPDDVHIYMSNHLSKVLDRVGENIKQRQENAANEDLAKYYAGILKKFATSKTSVYNDTFKNGVIRQANYLFRRRGFVETLDRVPDLFGVSNGVLRLARPGQKDRHKCEMIDRYHEYPVSRFTTVAWQPFNPDDTWTRIVLDALAAIIVEPDARDWILFHAAQGLSSEAKEGLLLIWEGGGQNGKTSALRWFAKALGPYADKFNIQLMSSEREDADKPNSAIMKFKNLNWAYSEESNKAQRLNVARMKEMVNAGEVSGRDLNSKQETFTMHCNYVAASQYSFLINSTDHGTWRRIRHYTSKTKFRKDPDPTNEFERADDQRFVREYPNDPRFLSAMLSVLSHYYERLQKEYGGELKNFNAPTVEAETEIFRVSQDTLHRWICERIVSSPGAEDVPTSVLGRLYVEWYAARITREGDRHVMSEVIKEIESSAISRFLKPAPNRTMVLQNCRILEEKEVSPREGETFMIGRPEAKKINRAVDNETWWEPKM